MNGGVAADARAVLMPGFTGLSAPEWVHEWLSDGLLSVCIYGDNVDDAPQLRKLGASLAATRPDVLVAIDEEGGEVTRVFYREGSPYPGASVLGRIDDLGYTEQISARVGADIQVFGANLALAPDADVNSNPCNPVIGTRSFAADPARAARHTAAWVRGLQSTGAIACPKHFPGHGDTAQDSHLALPTIDVSREVLEARDLPPFRAAIEAGARTIMTSHILLPQIDPVNPATLSRAVLQGILREHLGFTGVIMSDALDMRGASGEIGIPEAAVRAIAAGCDLLCIGTHNTPKQLREIEQHLIDAVSSGRLPADRLREAADRVRALAAERREALGAADSTDDRAADGAADSAANDKVAGAAVGVPPAGSISAAPSLAEVQRVAESFDGAADFTIWAAAHPDAVIVRIENEANMAVGAAPWGPFAAAEFPLDGTKAMARAFTARPKRTVSAATPASAGWIPDGTDASAPVIVIGRDLHLHEFARTGINRLRRAGVEVRVVDTGWPDPTSGLTPDLACYGSSRLAGAALLFLLAGSPSVSEASSEATL